MVEQKRMILGAQTRCHNFARTFGYSKARVQIPPKWLFSDESQKKVRIVQHNHGKTSDIMKSIQNSPTIFSSQIGVESESMSVGPNGNIIPELFRLSGSPMPRTWNLLLSPIIRGVLPVRLNLGTRH